MLMMYSRRNRRTHGPRKAGSVMDASPQSVLLEALAGFRQEFRCHREIDRGSRQICMSQINGQMRQQSLHLSALSVPCDETVNRESMAQIMNPRLVASAISAMDANMLSDPTEVSLESGHVNSPSVSGYEERGAAVL